MVRWAFVMAVLLGACAQVGSISGGPADELAPQVLEQTISDKQCNVRANEQLLVFDEFIKLDQAQQRITLMPADSRLNYELKGKTLRISFLDSLQPQTTYTLMSNGGIKDLTEGNDSLMTWTFSTGPILDSLQLTASAKELLPNAKAATINLGVYLSDTSRTARYIGRFDQQGKLQLKGLKDGAYFLKAYIDDNQDGACSTTESQDAFFKAIQLSQVQNDTLSFFLSKPLNEKDSSTTTPKIIEKKSDSSAVKSQLSSLLIEIDNISPNLLLELYLGEVLSQKVRVEKQTIVLDSLQSGLYTLRIVSDQNNNQKWDPIDLQNQKRAEALYIYPEKIKIRPNWELSLPVNIPPNSLFTN
jgi:Bacterial Ig-like domain